MITQTMKPFSVEDARQIGNQVGIDWEKFSAAEFLRDLEYEMEHTRIASSAGISFDDPIMAGEVVLNHLNESPDYYTHLIETELQRKEEPEDDYQAPQDPPEWWR